jgi:Domain of unknown function (DUF4169)
MAEIVNLHRARKAKARGEKEQKAEVNRVKHGVAKPARDLAKARADKEKRALDDHRIEDKK